MSSDFGLCVSGNSAIPCCSENLVYVEHLSIESALFYQFVLLPVSLNCFLSSNGLTRLSCTDDTQLSKAKFLSVCFLKQIPGNSMDMNIECLFLQNALWSGGIY